MATVNSIPITHLCVHYQADTDFFNALQEYELVEIIQVEQVPCIPMEQIKDVETLVHLHYDLNINLEGLDVISHLLTKMQELHQELNQVKSRLRGYELR